MIKGDESEVRSTGTWNGVPSFSVSQGNVKFEYKYSDSTFNGPRDSWHLVHDIAKKIDSIVLDEEVQRGTFIVQRSMDRTNWDTISINQNVFSKYANTNTIPLYQSVDIELLNGCYYRTIIAYEFGIVVDTHYDLFGSHDEYAYKRVAEVYEYYIDLDNNHIEKLKDNTKRYSLGQTEKVNDFASYSGKADITKGDLHYGWKLGEFFVSGFTSHTEKNGKTVFLKNVGDEVTLWFNLKENINALNGDHSMYISSDPDGYDQFFQTPSTDFGRGMLLIRYTDYENIKHDTIMYKDFLKANTSLGANTRVQMFEEGDYEVALDYEITKDQLIDDVKHYRISFSFSVRNANCMVYPFDVKTGKGLTNTSFTENGFYLDLANSRYLDIYIEKEVLTEGADGLTKDTRFNTTAKDNEPYTDDGIYTITTKNSNTGRETTKVIYVGENPILKAYAVSGYSISEINQLVSQGATINEDGSIYINNEDSSFIIEDSSLENNDDQNSSDETTIESDVVPESAEESSRVVIDSASSISTDNNGNNGMFFYFGGLVILLGCGGFVIFRKRSKSGKQ